MQLIRRGTLTGDALQMAHLRIAAGMDRIVSLVNDLLFVQEMELIEPALRPVKVPDVITALVAEAEGRAEAQNLTLEAELPPSLPLVEADPDGLLRALRAILDNAIKFSPGGGTIEIEVVTSDDNVDIAFRDPGIGIESEFLPRIFERFEHQERRGDYLFEGMGLGLAIARHLIESFGGSILVDTELDQGSTFTVRLPVMVADEPSPVSGRRDEQAAS